MTIAGVGPVVCDTCRFAPQVLKFIHRVKTGVAHLGAAVGHDLGVVRLNHDALARAFFGSFDHIFDL